jgi:Domain of unknown function (DUF397)
MGRQQRSLGEWFKSSYSNPSNNCVEVMFQTGAVHVRDAKNGDTGPVVTVDGRAWLSFLSGINPDR